MPRSASLSPATLLAAGVCSGILGLLPEEASAGVLSRANIEWENITKNKNCSRDEYIEIRLKHESINNEREKDAGIINFLIEEGVKSDLYSYFDAKKDICENGLAYAQTYCDKQTSAAIGPHREPRVTRLIAIGMAGYCSAVAQRMPKDAITWAQLARAKVNFYDQYYEKYKYCEKNEWCSVHSILSDARQAAQLGHPLGGRSYCIMVLNSRLTSNHSSDTYREAAMMAEDAWNKTKDGSSANCAARLYDTATAPVANERLALTWYKKAAESGLADNVRIRTRINELTAKIGSESVSSNDYPQTTPGPASGLSDAQIAVGVGAGIVCAFFKSCRDFAGDLVVDYAKKTAIDKGIEVLTKK